MQPRLELAHAAPRPAAHVAEVQVETADLDVPAGVQHALALADDIRQFRLGHGGEEAHHDGGEEIWRKGEGGVQVGMQVLEVVRKRFPAQDAAARRCGGVDGGGESVDSRVRIS